MRAVEIQEAQLAAAIAEQNKIFSQQSDFYGPSFGLQCFGKRQRPPVTPKHLASGRSWPASSHQFVFFLLQHCTILLLGYQSSGVLEYWNSNPSLHYSNTPLLHSFTASAFLLFLP